jgi:hypothetical protein
MLATLAFVSAVPFLGCVSLMIYAQIAAPPIRIDGSGVYCPHISFGTGVNATVLKDWGGCAIAFNQSYPYGGSTIGVAGDKSIVEKGWDGWGIYFRSFNTVGKHDLWWTLKFSLWYPVVAFGILPAIFVIKRVRVIPSRPSSEDVSKKLA